LDERAFSSAFLGGPRDGAPPQLRDREIQQRFHARTKIAPPLAPTSSP
jgi:hypothetical protein